MFSCTDKKLSSVWEKASAGTEYIFLERYSVHLARQGNYMPQCDEPSAGLVHPGRHPVRDGKVLLDIRHDRLIKLNPIASEMCELWRLGYDEPSIVKAICERYSAEERRVAADVRTFLNKLADLEMSPDVGVAKATHESESKLPAYPWYANPSAGEVDIPFRIRFLSFLGLAIFDAVLYTTSLEFLCSCVRAMPCRQTSPTGAVVVARICSAVRTACVWYPKRALCLQRSAVTACLLRLHGVPARMVIGARPMPLLAHAWVEVNGSVVNDWPVVKSFYERLVSQ